VNGSAYGILVSLGANNSLVDFDIGRINSSNATACGASLTSDANDMIDDLTTQNISGRTTSCLAYLSSSDNALVAHATAGNVSANDSAYGAYAFNSPRAHFVDIETGVIAGAVSA